MDRQAAVPASGTGHALVDLAGVARVKSHGEFAVKGLPDYVYEHHSSNSLKDEEAGSGSAADSIIESTIGHPLKPTSLPLALGRTHQRLSRPEELKRLHLQHHRMTTDQLRFRTHALHLPKSTYDLFDKIRSECEVCQAAKQAPTRSKTSGLRADTFGDMTFIDHLLELANTSLFLSSCMEQQHCSLQRQ